MKKLAIITTHPIQYYAPIFKLLASYINLKVFYTAGEITGYDRSFQQVIHWDIPLLKGYAYQFLENKAKKPGTHHLMGIQNPDAIEKLTAFKPTHLLIYSWSNYSHLKILRHFKGKIPILFRGDSTLLNKQSLLNNIWKTPILKSILKHIDTALFVGTNNKAYFKKFGLKERQLFFAPHAIDNERFAEKHPINLREKLGLESSIILILFAGKLEPIKNPELLLKAFLKLNQPDLHLLFVGNGIMETGLKQSSIQCGHVHFLPFQNQSMMPAVYQSCDLFCLPSKSETWGLSINESMASGKAILASDKVGAAIDLIRAANGKTFKSNDLPDLIEKLKEMTKSKAELKAYGEASKTIISSWNFDTQVKQILNAIHS